jgi:hypothetical protein
MRKAILTMVMGFVFLLPLFGGSLLDEYKTGQLAITPDPSFGQNTDWPKLLADPSYPSDPGFQHAQFALTNDGTIFLLRTTGYKVYKLNQKGELLLSFGKKGGHPGDFLSQPMEIITMDNRYVMVSDISMGIINIYDLNGHFVKKLTRTYAIHRMIPLADNKIAILGGVVMSGGPYKFLAAIVDAETGKETIVASEVNKNQSIMVKKDNSILGFGVPWRTVRPQIARSREGNLIWACSNKPEAVVFSPSGAQLGRIALNVGTKPISEEEKEEFRQSMQKAVAQLNLPESTLDAIKQPEFFTGNIPYFTKLMTDSEGSILLFKYTEDGSRQFQVYQMSGSTAKLVGEARMDFGPLGSADNLGPMMFHQGNLYVLGNLKSAGADGSRLIRVPLAGPAK